MLLDKRQVSSLESCKCQASINVSGKMGLHIRSTSKFKFSKFAPSELYMCEPWNVLLSVKGTNACV
jgi:hypothetical protein